MPTKMTEHEMSSEEQAYPREMAEGMPSRLGPLRLAINVGAASLFISMMSIHLCSLLVIWLVRTLTDAEIEQHSVTINWVIPWGGLASVVIAVVTAVLWVTGRKNNDLELLADIDPEQLVDLEAGQVKEEAYEFTEAQRKQEQERYMPARVRERAMSSEERRFLQDLADNRPTRAARFRKAIGTAAMLWGLAMALLILSWLLVAWLARIKTDIEIGRHSAAADWVIMLIVLTAALYAIVATVRWLMGWKDIGPSLLADLEAGRVAEENYEFSAAMRMQEQEHGGLLYFLRTADGAVLALFDHESQDIGVQGEDPLTSSFKPRARLTMVRAPETRLVIDKTFSGEPLDVGEPLDLLASPNDWPEDEEFCDIPWDDLEATFCR